MEYKIVRKKKKNASITLNNGLVTVSVPILFTDKMIEEFIKQSEPWIKSHIDKSIDSTILESIIEGETIYILGNPLIVRIIINTVNYIYINDGFLDINVVTNDDELIKNTYQKYISELRDKVYKSTLNKYLKLTNQTINKLRYKTMKRALGECFSYRKEIVLNTTLIHMNIEFIEAVIMHEIAHLVEPNHSQAFYDYIYKYMPDYDERMKNKHK